MPTKDMRLPHRGEGRVLRLGALSLDRLNEVVEPIGGSIVDEG